MKPYFGDNVWVDMFIREEFKEKYIIVTDWRFNVEYQETIKKYILELLEEKDYLWRHQHFLEV